MLYGRAGGGLHHHGEMKEAAPLDQRHDLKIILTEKIIP